MWQVVLPDIPKYFWVGKGYTASEADYYFAIESIRRGFGQDFDISLNAGDYHNGPLSILIPFGIFGLLTFLWFAGASWKLLYRYYRHGAPELRKINTLLLTTMTARLAFFLFGYGAVSTDLVMIVGFVGLSIAINGGDTVESLTQVAKPPPDERPVAPVRPRFASPLRPYGLRHR